MGNETKKLESKIKALKKRIEYLEQILEQAGIPYDVEQNSEPEVADNSVEDSNLIVRRHIVGGANRTLFSVDLPPRLCRTGT